MDKRFKLHIKWSNLTKTEGIAELSDNGQPLLKTECIEDARLLQTILNELHDKYIDEYTLRETLQLDLQRVEEENKELKFQLKECRENKLYSRRKLEEENTHIKNTITEMYNNERTELGKSTLKQLLNNIGEI